MNSIQSTHSLERTSSIGELFIGTCILCGTEGLTSKQANDSCNNPTKVTTENVLIGAIAGQSRCKQLDT